MGDISVYLHFTRLKAFRNLFGEKGNFCRANGSRFVYFSKKMALEHEYARTLGETGRIEGR